MVGTSSVPHFFGGESTFGAHVGQTAPLRCEALSAILDASSRQQTSQTVNTLVVGADRSLDFLPMMTLRFQNGGSIVSNSSD